MGGFWKVEQKLLIFEPYTAYAEVGELRINNNKVMWHLSIKLFDMFGQTLSHTLNKIMAKLVSMKKISKL